MHVSIERYTYLRISPLRIKHGASRMLGRFFPTQTRVGVEESSTCTVQADLRLSILLPQFPQNWGDQTAVHTWFRVKFWAVRRSASLWATQFISLSYTMQNVGRCTDGAHCFQALVEMDELTTWMTREMSRSMEGPTLELWGCRMAVRLESHSGFYFHFNPTQLEKRNLP